MKRYAIAILIWNIVLMCIYGIDKMLAKMHKRRISEAALLLCSFLMGGAGAIFGMVLFNHKTSKTKFRMLVPLTIVLEILFVYWIYNKY